MKSKKNKLPKILGLLVLVTFAMTACSTAVPNATGAPVPSEVITGEVVVRN